MMPMPTAITRPISAHVDPIEARIPVFHSARATPARKMKYPMRYALTHFMFVPPVPAGLKKRASSGPGCRIRFERGKGHENARFDAASRRGHRSLELPDV